MAKPVLCRLGLAQISVNPAYADELVSSTQEPTFPAENQKTGLFSISGLEEVGRLQQNLAEKYLAHLNHKIESVVRFSAADGVELLVFPEYSIPPETLPLCRSLCDELRIAIIAGSHVITLSQAAQGIYRDLEIAFDQPSSTNERVRQAACVVFVPGEKPRAFTKHVRSKWEGCLVEGASPFHSFQMNTRKGRIEVQVLICIEALAGKPPKEKHTIPRLVAITAFTPKVEPFFDYARLALLQGKCTVFANVAEFGGSRVFARAENTSLWFTTADGTKSVPKCAEAVLVVEADLEKQFEIRKSVTEQRAVTDVRLFPILYPTESAEAKQYAEIIDTCTATKPTPAEIGSQVMPFTALNSRVFPELLREKLAHFAGYIAGAGTVSGAEALRWVTPVAVRDIRSTDGLRWELCNQAADVVHKLLSSTRYVHKSKELSEVYVHLLNARNELAGSVQFRSDEAIASESVKVTPRPSTTESPFIDRDPAFDKIRQFFGQQQSSILILGGMRGIGKSAFVQESFRQAIPLRKRIWLQMTEGVSYQRLLAELAFGCNLQLPENLDLSAAETQDEVKRRILSHLRLGTGTVIVFDEFQFLLNPSAEIDDPRVREFLLGLAEAGQRGKTRYFFISHVFPRLGAEFESHFMSYSLSGLQPADTRRLLMHWVQFSRDDLQGRAPDPSERLITVLGGHPLATKVAARLWAEHPTADVAEEISIFKELRDTIVTFVLEKLSLSPDEHQLLSFASVFRLPAPREAFLKWRREDASRLLSSLAGHYLIESSERGYQLHPLVRSFFSHGISQEELRGWHKIAAKFYLQEFERLKSTSKQVVPEYLGEAVHHFLAAGDRQKVREFAFYAQELRPVALDHYHAGDFKVAMKDYQVLLEIDPNDVDAHFHLCLIFARAERWSDAEFHFGKAISIRARAPWILQAYGAAKIRAGKIAEGEELLLQAERAAPNHSPTLVELGRLRDSQGDRVAAEAYLRKAIQSDPDNAYAYYQLSRLLYREGQIEQALEMAKAALVCNPMNARNKALIQEIRKKIAEASPPSPSPRPVRIAVQVRCVETEAPQEGVKAIGGVNSDGKRWKASVQEAIARIEKGKYVFYVQTSDTQKLELTIARNKDGEKHLTTVAGDEVLTNLPPCP